MKPARHFWHLKKRKWLPIVVKGRTTGPEVKPACADCEAALPWDACKCWPEESRVPDASPRVQIQIGTRDLQPTLSERLNEEADERLQLVLLGA